MWLSVKNNDAGDVNSDNDKKNKFVRTFGYGSFLMLILFDFFLHKEQDSNECVEICDTVMSCRTMYRNCNTYTSRRRLLWSKIREIDTQQDQDKLNSVQRVLFDYHTLGMSSFS